MDRVMYRCIWIYIVYKGFKLSCWQHCSGYFPLFNITVLDKTATSLTVEWDSSVDLINSTGYYQIRYRGISSENSVSGSFYDVMEATVDINSMVYKITSLEPYSEYEISVSVLDKYTSVLSRTLESGK